MLNLSNVLYSVGIHAVTLLIIFVLPSMKLLDKPKKDVITVQLLAGIPSGVLNPPPAPMPVESEAVSKDDDVEPTRPTVAEEEAKPIDTDKPEVKPEKKPDEKKPEKKAEPKKKPTETKKRSQNVDSSAKKREKVKELDAAALANADDSGSGEVAVPAGSPFGTAKVDNASFTYTWWMTQTFNKIQSNMRNTVQTDERLLCELYFQVLRSGRVAEVKILTSSGDPVFDQDCLSALERSAPFPPLPNEFKEEIIGITLPFLNSN